jgi:hypothetical protein
MSKPRVYSKGTKCLSLPSYAYVHPHGKQYDTLASVLFMLWQLGMTPDSIRALGQPDSIDRRLYLGSLCGSNLGQCSSMLLLKSFQGLCKMGHRVLLMANPCTAISVQEPDPVLVPAATALVPITFKTPFTPYNHQFEGTARLLV